MTRTRVRRFERNELKTYRRLRLESLRESPASFGSSYAAERSQSDDEWRERFSRGLDSERRLPLVAELDGRAVGLAWAIQADDGRVEVFQMWVEPHARGRGLATESLLRVTEWARERQAPAIQLGVTKLESAAARLYRVLGFQATDCSGCKRADICHWMQLTLSDAKPQSVQDIEFVGPQVLSSWHMVDGDLRLVLREISAADHEGGFAPVYHFDMIEAASGAVAGHINLRVGFNHHLQHFRGNIGFGVDEKFRGRRFASRSCKLLQPLIRHHQMRLVWLTCNEQNHASRRTLEALGAEYVGTSTMPLNYPYSAHYVAEARRKRRYRWQLAR